jgi:hypothetical protein
VHVRSSEEGYGVLCALVRQAIFDGLKKATLTLGYTNCIPSPAILCPCGEGSTHMATMGEKSWICKKDETKYKDLAANHLVWKEEAHDAQKHNGKQDKVWLYPFQSIGCSE